MPDRAPHTVLVCDDQELMRVGLRMVVDSQPDLTVVGEAADGAAAIRQATTLKPDVILLDIRMPELDGVAVTRQVSSALPQSHIIVITSFDLDEYAYAALRAGAHGFLVKDAPAQEMLVAIRGVLRGDAMIAPSVTRRLLDRYVTGTAPATQDPRLGALTSREREVLALIGQGLTNAEIAGRLFLGESTVKTHVGRILTKLDARDRVGAVVFAYETGVVRPNG